MLASNFKTIDEYIALFPPDIRHRLQQLRQAIRLSAPEAIETISYQMPTYKLKGKNLAHFAAHKNHLGFYPTPSAIKAFAKELSRFPQSRGAVRFLPDKPIPLPLVKKIIKFRVSETLGQGKAAGTMQVCSRGHEFIKSKEVPVCPVCWPGRYKTK
ncbi:DUF1801 domain-containing protein [candidate division FCPU426 bacterium]|nr:DUF1801 domain-containing protein [candidate division FCPU426 bacterium]